MDKFTKEKKYLKSRLKDIKECVRKRHTIILFKDGTKIEYHRSLGVMIYKWING